MRIILCGFGVVGQSLVKLFDSRSDDLYSKYGLKPRVVGVFDSKGSAVNSSGLNLSKLVDTKKEVWYSEKLFKKSKFNVRYRDVKKY